MSNLKTIVNSCGEYYDPVTISGVYDRNVEVLKIPTHEGYAPINNIFIDAFVGMPNLKRVEIDDAMLRYYECFRCYPEVYSELRQSYSEWAKNQTELNYWSLPAYATDYSDLFIGAEDVRKVVIPPGVTNIRNAFSGSKIEQILIPESVSQMECALRDCPDLKEIVVMGEYNDGDLFGPSPSQVETVVCVSKRPVILGSTPNATWYVPYDSENEYKEAFEGVNESCHSIGCPKVAYKEIKSLAFFDASDYPNQWSLLKAIKQDYDAVEKLIRQEVAQIYKELFDSNTL